jgi:hypothetical protein
MRDSAQSAVFRRDILVKKPGDITMMFVTSRCNNAGPLGKAIPTRSFVSTLFARLAASRFRW